MIFCQEELNQKSFSLYVPLLAGSDIYHLWYQLKHIESLWLTVSCPVLKKKLSNADDSSIAAENHKSCFPFLPFEPTDAARIQFQHHPILSKQRAYALGFMSRTIRTTHNLLHDNS